MSRPILHIAADGPGVPKVYLTNHGHRFFVRVRPCPDDHPSLAEFGSYIEARTRARHLRFSNSWPLVDEVDATTRRRAEEAENLRLEAKRNGTAG